MNTRPTPATQGESDMNKRDQTHTMFRRLADIGIQYEDAKALRRIAMTLHRWFELECGTGNDWTYSIERDGNEDDSPPYLRAQGHVGKQWSDTRRRIADRETGARKRLAKIMSRYPGMQAYVQGDPRGASLYILRPGDVPEGASVDSCYNRGVAVYK